MREAIGLCFDFEWTNKNVMFSSYKRVYSYFQNTALAAKGAPAPEELQLLEPWRGKIPDDAFGEALMPPVSDGSGSDRALLRRANDLLIAAGCKRDGGVLKLPNGAPLAIEFLDSSEVMQPHVTPFQQNLRKLGIDAHSRIVDATQLKSRTDNFDFDILMRASGGSTTPGPELRLVFTARPMPTRRLRPTSPASPIPPSTRLPASPPMRPRATNSTPPAARSTACCGPDATGFRPGTTIHSGWPPGTYSRDPTASRCSASARPTPGGGTRKRRRRLGCKMLR